MDFLMHLFIYFLIYSFLGWVAETIYCSYFEKRFVYRGFLNGPYCPIYGFGALLVIYALDSFKDSIPMLFLMGLILTSILEYLTSLVMEKIFDMKWWDYSNKRFNINGRVCLLNSTMFGVLSVIAVKVLHPITVNIVGKIPDKILPFVAGMFSMGLLIDLIVTIIAIFQLKGALQLLETLMEDSIISERMHILTRRLLHAFPDLKSVKSPMAVRRLKDTIRKYKEEHGDDFKKKQLD